MFLKPETCDLNQIVLCTVDRVRIKVLQVVGLLAVLQNEKSSFTGAIDNVCCPCCHGLRDGWRRVIKASENNVLTANFNVIDNLYRGRPDSVLNIRKYS